MAEKVDDVIQWRDFLISAPPGTLKVGVQGMFEPEGVDFSGKINAKLLFPSIKLPCTSEECKNHEQNFGGYSPYGNVKVELHNGQSWTYVIYRCKNCGGSSKSYAVYVAKASSDGTGSAIKVGEWPGFGTRTPRALFKMLGQNDRGSFLKCRRAE